MSILALAMAGLAFGIVAVPVAAAGPSPAVAAPDAAIARFKSGGRIGLVRVTDDNPAGSGAWKADISFKGLASGRYRLVASTAACGTGAGQTLASFLWDLDNDGVFDDALTTVSDPNPDGALGEVRSLRVRHAGSQILCRNARLLDDDATLTAGDDLPWAVTAKFKGTTHRGQVQIVQTDEGLGSLTVVMKSTGGTKVLRLLVSETPCGEPLGDTGTHLMYAWDLDNDGLLGAADQIVSNEWDFDYQAVSLMRGANRLACATIRRGLTFPT